MSPVVHIVKCIVCKTLFTAVVYAGITITSVGVKALRPTAPAILTRCRPVGTLTYARAGGALETSAPCQNVVCSHGHL